MTIHVDVITPEKLALSEDVDFIAAPGADGEFGILPGHAPLLARLGFGELRLRRGADTIHFAVAGGFLEVQEGSRVSVFAESADLANEIDVEKARLEAESTKNQLKVGKGLTGEQAAALEAQLLMELARLKVGQIRRSPRPPQGN